MIIFKNSFKKKIIYFHPFSLTDRCWRVWCVLNGWENCDVPLVELMPLVLIIRMPGESYRKRPRSMLLCLCDVFREVMTSFVYWFFLTLRVFASDCIVIATPFPCACHCTACATTTADGAGLPCVAVKPCPSIIRPVCATNGITYSNQCLLNAAQECE